MWAKHLTLIVILVLTGIGLVSAWNFMSSKPSPMKEGFAEPSTDEDIDYFVAVSNALKKVNKTESSAKEVRRIVADMRSKQVKVANAEHFVRTNGGRNPIKEPLEIDPNSSDEEEDRNKNVAKTSSKNVNSSAKDTKGNISKENFDVKQDYVSIGSVVADKLTKELNDIADRIDEIVEEISKLKSSKNKSAQPPPSTTEGFTNFPSWSVV
jgi:hypothetical protein